jgi:alkanesulfonate monooxygenase SsuD/methylene tetrahydromethanopterin reductase-like flavin-dependent oxidoreductase (luciferase family)
MGFKDALAGQRPTATAKYTFDTLTVNSDHAPVIEVRHAGPTNKAYKNAELALAGEAPVRRGKDSEQAQLERARFGAKLIARGDVVISWQNVHEERGGAVAVVTPEKVEELLNAFIDEGHLDEFWMFVFYCRNAVNFRESSGSGVELGKR